MIALWCLSGMVLVAAVVLWLWWRRRAPQRLRGRALDMVGLNAGVQRDRHESDREYKTRIESAVRRLR